MSKLIELQVKRSNLLSELEDKRKIGELTNDDELIRLNEILNEISDIENEIIELYKNEQERRKEISKNEIQIENEGDPIEILLNQHKLIVTIDFDVDNAQDHKWLRSHGYEIVGPYQDCTYSVKGLKGFSPSSYGNWGTIYKSFANDKAIDVFIEMLNDGVIKPWRYRYKNKDVVIKK